MSRRLLAGAVLVVSAFLLAPVTDGPLGAGAWVRVKNLLTAGSCATTGPCDLAAGTTIGGAAIGGGGSGDFLANGTVPMTGDLNMADNDIVNPDAVGADIYYVNSIAEAQAALTRCGSDITGSTQSGCIVQFAGGLHDNGGVTLSLAGNGSGATGRSGVILRGTGGGAAAGVAGNPISGTILKSSGAVPVIDVGSCAGCVIENLTIAGEDVATVGVDFLAPGSGYPTTRFVMRNVSMYEINGYCIRTPTSGQVDTMIFENVSCRDSDGAFQQRDSQTVGIILTNFDANMLGTASGPVFDIQEGDFTLVKSYLAIKNNEVGIRLGKPASRVIVDNNQLEFGTSTSAVLFDFDEGASTTESNITISNNHIVYAANGNTLFDVQRKGSISVLTNSWQDITGSLSLTSDFMVDDSNVDNRLYLNFVGNMEAHAGLGGTKRPERWAPTLTANPTHSVLPTLSTPTIAAKTLPTPCLNGESGIDTDATTGQRLQVCESGTWTVLGYQPLDSDLTSIAALTTTAFGRGLLDDADGAAVRTTIGAVIGTNVQAWDADLDSVAALATTAGGRSILATTPADDQVYVGDSASAGTWRSVPDCGESGTLNYTASTNTFSCLTDGGANAVEVIVDFGAAAAYDASTVVTGQTWVTASSKISCSPTLVATSDRLEGNEEALLDQLFVAAHSRVVGTGFTVNAASPTGAHGKFAIHCVGV